MEVSRFLPDQTLSHPLDYKGEVVPLYAMKAYGGMAAALNLNLSLKFRGPCIMIHSYNKTNKMH